MLRSNPDRMQPLFPWDERALVEERISSVRSIAAGIPWKDAGAFYLPPNERLLLAS